MSLSNPCQLLHWSLGQPALLCPWQPEPCGYCGAKLWQVSICDDHRLIDRLTNSRRLSMKHINTQYCSEGSIVPYDLLGCVYVHYLHLITCWLACVVWLTVCWSRPTTPAGNEAITTTWTGMMQPKMFFYNSFIYESISLSNRVKLLDLCPP